MILVVSWNNKENVFNLFDLFKKCLIIGCDYFKFYVIVFGMGCLLLFLLLILDEISEIRFIMFGYWKNY